MKDYSTLRRTCSIPIHRIPRLQSARLNSQRVHFCTLEPAFASSTTIYLRFIDTVSETRLLLYRLHCSSSLAVSSRLNLKKICGYPARSTRRVISFKIYIYIFFAIYSIKYLNSTLEYQSYMQIIQYNIQYNNVECEKTKNSEACITLFNRDLRLAKDIYIYIYSNIFRTGSRQREFDQRRCKHRSNNCRIPLYPPPPFLSLESSLHPS